ncbi:MAG: hypothetical protein KBS81_09290, partial [Spirochaetales bacterium]|nr:hypothetical protein [Candidatus Physcosoma equi]
GETVSAVKSVNVPYDEPRVINLSLKGGTKLTSDSVKSYTFKVQDAGDNYLNGKPYAMVGDRRLNGSYYNYQSDNQSFEINPTWFKNGEYNVEIHARDNAGNEIVHLVPIVIERPVPTIKSVSMADGTVVAAGESLNFSVEVEEAKNLTVLRTYSDDTLMTSKYYMGDNVSSIKEDISIMSQYMADGTHVLSIEAEDNVGNVVKKSFGSFSISGNSVPPTISNVSVKEGDVFTRTGTVRFTAKDDGGVRAARILVDGVVVGTVDGSALEYSDAYKTREFSVPVNVYALKNGVHEMTICASDFAGNEKQSKVSIEIQKTEPNLTLKVKERRATFETSVTLSDSTYVKSLNFYAGSNWLGSVDKESGLSNFNTKETIKTDIPDGTYAVKVSYVNAAGEVFFVESGYSISVDSNAINGEDGITSLTQMSGVISLDEKLHWTKAMSPIVITGDVIINAGKTLVIDPGVTVLFEGPYSIQIREVLDAVGTESEPIIFKSSGYDIPNHDGYYGNWGGIMFGKDNLSVTEKNYRFTYNSGNIMKNVVLEDTGMGINGYAYVENADITSTAYALGGNGNFKGYLLNSNVKGKVSFESTRWIFGNIFDGSILGEVSYSESKGTSSFYGNYLYNFVNNLVVGHSIYSYSTLETIQYNTFKDCYLGWSGSSKRYISYNTFDNLRNSLNVYSSVEGISFSNFINCDSVPVVDVTTGWNQKASHDFTYNYWGDYTGELIRLTAAKETNASFIRDVNDDSSKSYADWSNFVTEPWTFVGYHGEDFFEAIKPFAKSLALSSDAIEVGDDLTVNFTLVNTLHLKSYKVMNDDYVMKSESFADNGNSSISREVTFDAKYLQSGTHSIYVVGEDYYGNTFQSEVISYSVDGTDTSPTIEGFYIVDGQVFSEYTTIEIPMTFADEGGVRGVEMTMNGQNVINPYYYEEYEDSLKSYKINAKFKVPTFANGDYELVLRAFDFAGNETVERRQVTVAKTLPTATLTVRDGIVNPRLDSRAWVLDGQVLVDGAQRFYYFINAAESTDSWAGGYTFRYQDLPVGEHVVQARLVTQGGDVILSEPVTIPVEGTKDDSSYGVGKTWNEDGTLRNDGSTRYLWNFDDDAALSKETVRDVALGTVSQTTEGLGKNGGNIYYNVDGLNIPFFSGEWTMEYWFKGNTGKRGDCYINIRGLMYGDDDRVYSYSGNPRLINLLNYIDMAGTEQHWRLEEPEFSWNNYQEWHHFAIVSTGNRFEIYYDGIMVAHSDNTPSVTKATGFRFDLLEGCYLDEVRLSGTARSKV